MQNLHFTNIFKSASLHCMRMYLHITLICTLITSVACQTQPADDTGAEPSRPNIIVIVADDMGYSDIGCYGSEIHTPNIDALAANGVRFTQFYNTGRCSPSRASLLTGLYPHQAGVGYLTSAWADHHREKLGAPGYTDHLTAQSVTIAEALQPAGYKSYLSGKWHVGQEKPHWPYYRGFDQSLVLLSGYHYFHPDEDKFARNDSIVKPASEGFYSTDFFTDNAVEFINAHSSEAPFFLYLAYTAPHLPLHAPEAAIAQYEGSYMKGWDSLRVERFARMRQLGLLDANQPLSPRHENIPAWSTLTDEEKKLWDRRMAVYAAQIQIMDDGIGRVVRTLKEKGVLENTIIMFLSDNGGSCEVQDRGAPDAKVGSPASYTSYGAWANLSNVPFRLFKRFVHEGGIATPLVVHWPEGIRESNIVRSRGHLIDIMPTCLDVAGVPYPAEYNGHSIIPTPGKSLLPFLTASGEAGDEPIFWEHEGNRALLAGKYKLVAQGTAPWELYNLEVDRAELNDLAGQFPQMVQGYAQQWQQWADSVGVVPWHTTGRGFEVYDFSKPYERK
jgi:arylsulfatase